MRLKNICAGKTQQQDIRGQSITTAYIKTALTGAVEVTINGIAGNDVAVHTDHVYAIAEEHYAHWARRLKVSADAWAPGFFAENLTISGLNEKELNVGDVLRIGSEVRLRVTGPRVPCFKLCWRLNQPDSFLREFAISGKSGVYLSVLRTGQICAGDPVHIESRASNTVNVQDLVEYFFGEQTIDEAGLVHILNLEGISETSVLLMRNRLYQILDQRALSTGRWQGWREFEVQKIVDEADKIKSFVLSPSDGKPIAQYRAGQFLTIELPSDTSTHLVRLWSISDFQANAEHYRISVSLALNSTGGSIYMHNSVKLGSRLRVRAPMGTFVLDRSGFTPVLLIAGGIGITPLLSMLKAHIDRGEKSPPLYFIHCVRNRRAQAFRDTLDEIEANHNVQVLHVYDQPHEEDVPGIDYGLKGWLSLSAIRKFMKDSHIVHAGKKVEMPWFESDIYICGPPVFQTKLVEELVAGGAKTHRIFTESFIAGESNTESTDIEQSDVQFTASNKSAQWNAVDGLTLLELAESVDLQPNNACRMGVCQSCSATLLDGSVHYPYRLTHQPEEGQVLLCSAVPASKRVLIDL